MREEPTLQQEQLLTVSEAAQHCPGRPSVRTIWRWISEGVRGVHLESVAVGCRRYTSAEALQRFVDATSEKAGCNVPATRPANAGRSKSRKRASQELDRVGIK